MRVVDGETFAVDAAGERGPLLVAQCWSTGVLSDIKLSVESAPAEPVTVLHHLGLDRRACREVAWDDLDRTLTPDHLTSLWIPQLAAPVAAELVRLDELVHVLRERCPWDRRQTHGSLARHLLEESYEVLEAIDALAAVDGGIPDAAAERPVAEERAVAHLEEELGDLLFQVYFHATLAAEAGRFTLADVARGVHDKLVSRHPHVFGDVTADTPEEVAAQLGGAEAGREGPHQRDRGDPGRPAGPGPGGQAAAQGPGRGHGAPRRGRRGGTGGRRGAPACRGGGRPATVRGHRWGRRRRTRPRATSSGDLLFSLVNVARQLGVDPETALRSRAGRFRSSVEERG